MAEVEQLDSVRDLAKKKILAILDANLELQGDIYNVKLFSCDRDGKNWLFSDVEGYLGFIVNYQIKTKYLVIYDSTTFEKLFQYELYNNFVNYYKELADEFRSFEIDSGFMGFQFDSKEDAVKFDLVIKRLSGLTNDLFAKPRTKEDLKSKEKLAEVYCKQLKEKFNAGDKYDENYAEDGTTILKHNNFKILQNIEYNKETKQFKFGDISEELKQMFLSFGISKKELERDADFAFTLFKKVIVGLGNENALKNSALDSIEHVFPPPEEREKLRRQEEAAEAKMNSVRNQRIQQKRRETKPKKQEKKQTPKPQTVVKKPKATTPASSSNSSNSNNPSKVSGVPQAPPPPPPPPPPPGVPGAVPIIDTKAPTPNESKTVVKPSQPSKITKSKEQEISEVQLKKVAPTNDKIIKGTQNNFLQNALSTAIRNRRNNLHMHDDEEDEDEEDDW